MPHQPARRTVLAGLSGAAWLAAPRADAGEVRPEQTLRAPRIQAFPVTAEHAVLAVDSGSRSDLTVVAATDSRGAVVARAALSDRGTAVLAIPMPPGGRATVKVWIGNAVPRPTPTVERVVTVSTDERALSDSLWRVVNKRTPMSKTQRPRHLEKVLGVEVDARVAADLTALVKQAERAGAPIYPSNGYRSYDWQSSLYRDYAQRDGKADADTYSARPGYSEHQTGLSFDAKARDGKCSLEECFGATPAGKFLAAHAADFGFVVRYTRANTAITGYRPEPWHLRYVGRWLTAHLKASGRSSLEDAFALPAAPGYR